MAINYSYEEWYTGKYFTPDNMNNMEEGIKSACDFVDANAIIPDVIEEVKVLGWSTPKPMSVRNYVDSSRQLHVKVGRIRIADLNFVGTFWASLPTAKENGEVYCVGYNSSRSTYSNMADKDISLNITGLSSSQQVIIKDSAYSTASAFKSAKQDSYIYYELKTEIVIPIDGSEIVNDQECLKYLGWTVPKQLAVKNVAKNGGGLIQRVGRVDLGTLSWSVASTSSGVVSFSSETLSNVKIPTNDNTVANAFVKGFTFKSRNAQWAGGIGDISINQSGKIFANTSYTDATAFRSAMSGVYLYYELASEVTMAEGKELIPKIGIDGLTFSVSGNTLSISNGTKTWTLT